MTLYQYLDTLEVTSTSGGVSRLFYSRKGGPLVNGLDQTLQGPPSDRPYARVDVFASAATLRTHDRSVLEPRLVQVSVYQQPTASEDTPDDRLIMPLFDLIMRADAEVDAPTHQQLMVGRLRYEASLEPTRDADSRGLFGFIRFREPLWRPTIPS